MDGRLKRLGMPDGTLPPPPKVPHGGPVPFPYLRRGAPIRRLCQWSVSKPPTGEELLKQWERARGHGKTEEKIRLGSMLLDIEATVDSSLVRNRDGENSSDYESDEHKSLGGGASENASARA